jgi:hypothetical protein
MKKVFGVLSLIAILTVAFTSQASASDGTDYNVEFVISDYSPVYVAVATVDVPVFGVFNVADEPVNYMSKEGVFTANIVSGDSTIISKFGTSFAEVFLPNEVGLTSKNIITNFETVPNLTEYVSNYNYTYGYEVPDIVKRISVNVGKLTKIPINS